MYNDRTNTSIDIVLIRNCIVDIFIKWYSPKINYNLRFNRFSLILKNEVSYKRNSHSFYTDGLSGRCGRQDAHHPPQYTSR